MDGNGFPKGHATTRISGPFADSTKGHGLGRIQ
jgi:hypothetical protein